MCAMTKSIRTILTPLLMVSYVLGSRIANLSANRLKLWFNLLYMLLIWSVYYYLSTTILIQSFDKGRPENNICYWMEIFTTILSIIFGVYREKKFQNCLMKLDNVDDTLHKLGTITDYDKLHKKTVWHVLTWFVIVLLMNCSTALHAKAENDWDILTALYIIFMINFCFHINIIGDLTATSIIGYIGLKFDQVNEHLLNLTENNKHEIKFTWKNSVIHSHRHKPSKALCSKCMTWILIHLHLELRKISCEIDSIFGTQMTFKMACYFGWLAIDIREFYFGILINNYVKSSKIVSAILYSLWISHNVFKFVHINYVCEIVITKANATGKLINRLSHSTCDVELHEMISQFSLQMVYAPLRFYGIGFQFGFKFLHRFITSVATVLVIVIQAHANK